MKAEFDVGWLASAEADYYIEPCSLMGGVLGVGELGVGAPEAPGVGSWRRRRRPRELELGVGAPEAPPGVGSWSSELAGSWELEVGAPPNSTGSWELEVPPTPVSPPNSLTNLMGNFSRFLDGSEQLSGSAAQNRREN